MNTVLRTVICAGIFLLGWLEGRYVKKEIAIGTWALGLVALSAWIAYPLTTLRIAAAIVTVTIAVILMRWYYVKPLNRG
jgi:hypothetical protein